MKWMGDELKGNNLTEFVNSKVITFSNIAIVKVITLPTIAIAKVIALPSIAIAKFFLLFLAFRGNSNKFYFTFCYHLRAKSKKERYLV